MNGSHHIVRNTVDRSNGSNVKFPSHRRNSAGRAALARATASIVCVLAALMPAHATQTQTRVTAFEYEPNSAIATKVLTEPDVSALCVITTHVIDSYGHKTSSTTRNCRGNVGANPPYNNESAAPPAGDPSLFVDRMESAHYTDARFSDYQFNAAGEKTSSVQEAAFGSVTSATDVNTLTAASQFDGFGRTILESRPDGTGTKWTYKYCTSVSGGTEVCPTIGDQTAVYVVTETPVNLASGAQNGAATISYFDATGHALRMAHDGFDGAGATTVYVDTQYNAQGLVWQQSRPYYAGAQPAGWTVALYDSLGRVSSVTAPDGGQTVTTYHGLTVTVRDAMSHNTTTVRDTAGQISSVTDHLNNSTNFTYSAFGDVLTATDPLGNVVSQQRDLSGRVYSLSDPDLGLETYRYDALGELVGKTNGRNESTTRTYDLVGRLTSSTTNAYVGHFYYGAYADGTPCPVGVGKLCDMTSSTGYEERYQFDSFGRASSVTQTIDKAYQTSFSYDPTTGSLGSVRYPNGLQVATNYTPRGFALSLTNASSGATYWHADTVNADMSLANETFGGLLASQSGYDAKTGRLLTRSTTAGSASLQSLLLGYDYVGNLTSRTDAGTGVFATYFYDELNRLKTELRQGGGVPDRATYSNWFTVFVDDDLPVVLPGTTTVQAGQQIDWTYDAIGNIRSRSDVGAYNYPPSGASSVRPHAVQSITGTVNGVQNPGYNYDSAGNLQNGDGRTATFTNIDIQPMPTQFTRGVATINFWYAPDKRRVKETALASGAVQRTTNYAHPLAYPGLLYEEDALTGGVTRQRAYIGVQGTTIGVVTTTGSASQTSYWLKDQLGSIDVVADGSGNVLEHLDYEPFGKRRGNGATDQNGTLASTSTNRGFTGHEELDEVGLVHMNGRVYDPSIGRFVSPDPTIPHATNPQSYNRFAYVMNNPLSLTDPSGYADDGSGSTGPAGGQQSQAPSSGTGDGQAAPKNTAGSPDASYQGLPVSSDPNAKYSPEERAEQPLYSSTFSANSDQSQKAKDIGKGASDFADATAATMIFAVQHGAEITGFDIFMARAFGRLTVEGAIEVRAAIRARNAARANEARLAVSATEQQVVITGRLPVAPTEGTGLGTVASRCASCCFSGDTPILAEGGLVRIDTIHVGDRVEARDEKTGRTALRRVTNVIVSQNRELYALTLLEDQGRATRVEVTDNHPFWVTGQGWVQSIDLRRGMKLVSFDRKLVTVVNLEDLQRKATTYNLTVDGYHTFFAGESLALVHNAGSCCGRQIALGMDLPGRGMKSLSEQTGAPWWHFWAESGITRRSVQNKFGRALHSAVDSADRIHFSLDGIADPLEAARKGAAGFSLGNMTNAELNYIANNPAALAKTTFYREGVAVPSPFSR